MLWWPLDLYDTLRIAVGSPPEPPVRVPCGRPQPDEDKEEIFHRIKPGSSPEGVWGCHKLDTPWISGGRQPLDLAKDRPTHCPTRSGNGVGSLFLSGQTSSRSSLAYQIPLARSARRMLPAAAGCIAGYSTRGRAAKTLASLDQLEAHIA